MPQPQRSGAPPVPLAILLGAHKLASGSSACGRGANVRQLSSLGTESWWVHGGLDYMHRRYCSPVTGRFLSFDPVMQTGRAKKKPGLWNRYAYALGNPMNFIDPKGEDVSIAVTFKGGALTDEQKAEILRLVSGFFKSLNVGKVFVFDSAKFNETNTSLFGLAKSTGVGSVTIDSSNMGETAKTNLVPGGRILSDSSLTGAQKLQAIANVASHEVLAHQFGINDFQSIDAMAFDRNTIFKNDPAVQARYGTIADHGALVDPNTRDAAINGPLPIHAADLARAQSNLGASTLSPPSPRDN